MREFEVEHVVPGFKELQCQPHQSVDKEEDRFCANRSSSPGWTQAAGKCLQQASPCGRPGQKSLVTQGSMACLLVQDKWGRDSLKPQEQIFNWIDPQS